MLICSILACSPPGADTQRHHLFQIVIIITREDLPMPDMCVGLPGEFSDHSLLISQFQLSRPPVCFADVSTPSKTASADSLWPTVCACHWRHMLAYRSTNCKNDTTPHYAPSWKNTSKPNCTSPMSADYTRFDADCAKAKRQTRAFEWWYQREKLDSDLLVWIGQARKKQRLFAAKQNQFWDKKISDSKGDLEKPWRHLSGALWKV